MIWLALSKINIQIITLGHVSLGLDTNISKNGLNMFPEILKKSSKHAQKNL